MCMFLRSVRKPRAAFKSLYWETVLSGPTPEAYVLRASHVQIRGTVEGTNCLPSKTSRPILLDMPSLTTSERALGTGQWDTCFTNTSFQQ